MTGGEILVGAATAIGTAIGAFTAVKKVPFWKRNENRDAMQLPMAGCPDQDCHDLVIITTTKVTKLEEGQALIFDKLDEMPDKIIARMKEMKGWLSL